MKLSAIECCVQPAMTRFFRYSLKAGMLTLLIDALVFPAVPMTNVRSISSGSGLGYFAELLSPVSQHSQSAPVIADCFVNSMCHNN